MIVLCKTTVNTFKMTMVLVKIVVNTSPLKTDLDNRYCIQCKLFKKPKWCDLTSVLLLGFFQFRIFLSLVEPCSVSAPKPKYQGPWWHACQGPGLAPPWPNCWWSGRSRAPLPWGSMTSKSLLGTSVGHNSSTLASSSSALESLAMSLSCLDSEFFSWTKSSR